MPKTQQNANLHDLLNDWPYARNYLLSTMDGDLIEAHALLQLSRALNIGSVVAFLSAGVSMAYGRISWRQLVVELADETMADYETIKEHYLAESKLPSPRLATLFENLRSLDIKNRPRGDSIKADRYPSVFQLCAELSEAIDADEKVKGRSKQKQFSQQVKLRTRDGHFHAISLLARHVKGGAGDSLAEAIKDASQTWDAHVPQDRTQLFKTQNIIDYIFAKHEAIQTELHSILDLSKTGTLERLKPSLRFLVPAALQAAGSVEQRDKIAAHIRKYIEQLPGSASPTEPQHQPPPINPSSDIVGTLQSRLAIRRFLTTNFDLELERMIFDQGFVPPKGGNPPGAAISVDPLDHTARDFVVRAEESAALVDLALQGGGHRMDVAHLHGRALPGEPIVATETEYQDLYLRDDRYRDPLDEAIRLAFRGNTLLFVGSGMGEDDILRPLRHFMSEAGGPTQPASIALLPLRGSDASVIEEKIALLRRYGVYAIHWGRGKTEAMTKSGPLLPTIRALIVAIGKALEPNENRSTTEWDEALVAARNASLLNQAGPLRLAKLEIVEELTRESDPNIPDVTLSDVIEMEWAALDFALRTADDYIRDPEQQDPRRVVAARVVAEEIEDAMMSAFLTAAVHRLAKRWDHWRTDWFGDLSTRPALPNSEPENRWTTSGQDTKTQAQKWISNTFVISRRRALALRQALEPSDFAQEETVLKTDPLYRPRWSQTYSDFLSALREGARANDIPKEGRRVFFLAGRRGLGKGHFFSALTDHESFLDYATSAGSAELIYGLYAFNLSFSVELGSGFEIMAEFMFRRIIEIYKDQVIQERDKHIRALEEEYSHFTGGSTEQSGDRVGALRFLFEVMAGTATVASPASSDKSASFDNSTAPMRFTLDKPCGRIALALNATHLLFNPRGFAKSSDVVRFFEIFLDPRFNMASIDLIFVTSETGLPIEVRRPVERKHDDPSRILNGGEKEVQHIDLVPLPAIGRSALSEQTDETALTNLRLRLNTNRPPPPNGTMTAYFHRLQPPRISVVIMSAFPRVAMTLARQCLLLQSKTLDESVLDDADFEKEFSQPGALGEKTRIAVRDAAAKIARKAHDALVPEHQSTGREQTDFIDRLAEEVNAKFAGLYKALGRNRFCISIVCAAVDEIIECGGSFAQASNKLAAFMTAFAGLAEQSREDALLREVLDHYRKQAVKRMSSDCPLAVRLEKMSKPEGVPSLLQITNFWSDFQMLQEELMAILAMIGTPVEADCLSYLKIRALDALAEKKEWLKDESRRNFLIEEALERLVRRSLVFRFVPRSEESGTPKFRFGVHRLVQRHGLRRMHQPRVEFPEVDSYMPTLYASQPNDLPYPTSDAQERIRDMVARLSFYPSDRRWGPSGFVPTVEPERAARMLRAAYSILRGVYSIASVARFDAYVPAIKPPLHGFFEEHRHNIRWVLRRAKALQEQLDRQNLPFFAGDIVWLYNECGTLSLLQGSLYDAAKLLSVGLKAVQRIEAPAIGGALTNSLKLNRAIVDIEMGKCRKADAALVTITMAREETRAVRWIAWGYRGLVAHIRGDSKLAEENYLAALGALRSMKRHRAASIFARHCADLYRHAAPSRVNDALAMADDAVKFASIGNHEDVYHLARLTRLRAQLERQRLAPETKLDRDLSDARKTLDNIATYARIMGMPRLLIDTEQLDSLFRFDTGDLHYASRSVTRALSLANENGMILKKVSLTILLASIYLRRGMADGARLLAENARNLAIQCEYATAQDDAHEILSRV